MKNFFVATSLASIASAIDLQASSSIAAEQTNPDWLTANLAAAYATNANPTEEIVKIVAIVNALTTPSSYVTVNCCCCESGIDDPHKASNPVGTDDDDHPCKTHYIPITGGGVTVNCGCCDEEISDPW